MKTQHTSIFILSLLFLASCSSESAITDTAPEEIVALAKAPASVAVGTEIILDGSDSTGPIDFYGWLIVSKPQSSGASIQNSENVQANLTPDVEGEYIIRLLVISNETLSDSDDITVNATE